MNPITHQAYTRREFLRSGSRGLGLIAFSGFAPHFLTQNLLAGTPAPESDRSILVLIQLAGGNDGLNTLIPFEDDRYYRLRPNLAVSRKEAIRIGDNLGLHPRLGAFRSLLDEGKLGVIQNVGYPNPNRSHFRSGEIWETASDTDDFLATGWIGRYFDATCSGRAEPSGPAGIHLSTETPQAYLGQDPHETFGLRPGGAAPRRRRGSRSFERRLIEAVPDQPEDNLGFLRHTMLDAIITEEKIQQILADDRAGSTYPNSSLARSLRQIATMIQSGLPTRVYFASLGGFDTHANQANTHGNLLETLGAAMAAFQSDLESRGLADQVLTMTFSEFGRRPAENNGKGTDHGTAAPLFVMGNRIQPGMHGTAPDLEVGPKEDLRFGTDFRGVYARILDTWLDCPSEVVLGGKFDGPAFV